MDCEKAPPIFAFFCFFRAVLAVKGMVMVAGVVDCFLVFRIVPGVRFA